jgi:hypothetical protein
MSNAKKHMYVAYDELYSSINVPNVILLVFQSCLFIFVLIILTYNFVSLCRKLREVFKIIINVERNELQIIKKYWYEL